MLIPHGLPQKLTSSDSETVRGRYRVVRLDCFGSLSGSIMSASVETGLVTMRQRGPNEVKDGVVIPTYVEKSYDFGPNGIAIVRR